MLTAYFDDSGTDGQSPSVVLAGYVAPMERWKSFSLSWDNALRDCKLAYFKATEAEPLKGQFDGWTEPDRNGFLLRLASIISQHAFSAIVVALEQKHYDKYIRGRFKKHDRRLDHPYYALFFATMLQMKFLNERLSKIIAPIMSFDKQQYKCIFDRQNFQESNCLDIWRAFEPDRPSDLPRPSFEDDKEVLPLQAADLLAWHTRRRKVSPQESRPIYKELDKINTIGIDVPETVMAKMEVRLREAGFLRTGL